MIAAQHAGKGKCCQVYPKHSRYLDAGDTHSTTNSSNSSNRSNSSSRGPEQVFALAMSRGRRPPNRTTSWRYHPRPRQLVRPQSERSLESVAAAAAAAAAVPPSWLKSSSGADLLMLAAGTRGGGSLEGGCRATRHRSLSDSVAVLASSAPSPPTHAASPAREAARQLPPGRQTEHQKTGHHADANIPHQEDMSVADQSFDIQETGEGTSGERAVGMVGARRHGSSSSSSNNSGDGGGGGGGVNSSTSASVSEKTQKPAAPTSPTATTPKSAKAAVPLLPSWLRFVSRRRARLREENSPVCRSSQDCSPVAASPSLSPAAAAAAPLLSSTAKRSSLRSAVRSSFRRGRKSGPKKASRGGGGGKATTAVVAAALACGAILEPALVSALTSSALSFDPPVVGYPTEITFTFTPTWEISAGKFIRLNLPGFTRGERNGTAGEDLGFNNEDDKGNEALAWPSETFRGWWTEGTPEEEYEDSVFNLYTTETLSPPNSYTAIIDRSSSIKSNCGHPADDPLFLAWVDDETTFYKMFGRRDFYIDTVQEIPMSCYMAPTSLKFDPPLPKTLMHIIVGFQPARNLVVGDTVTVDLKGFTSGEADGVPGADIAMGSVALEGSDWEAEWVEGTHVDGEPGFEDSTLRLEALVAIPAGEMQEVKIYRSNGIKAQCGMAENGTSSTISVTSASDPAWDASGEFTYTQAIGSGCLDLNYCSGQGECDYCLQLCHCPEGFGSLSDLEGSPGIARDCSQMTCPSGVSWTPVLSGYPRPNPDASHSMAECSNMGTCIRSFGICLCEVGFEGRACERYACPNECSGNGACRSMRELGLTQAATPLVDAAGSEVAYGRDTPEGSSTWDSRSVFGCVCDSSWEVGLGAGQTQEAEFFGPDCSMVHCPSGDDPETDEDETDCEDVVGKGGQGVGSAGNLCHVDCSNRGICDHGTGVCRCFDGYHGQACNKKHGDGYGFNTDGM